MLHFEDTGKLMNTPISKPNTANFNTLNRQEPLVIVTEAIAQLAYARVAIAPNPPTAKQPKPSMAPNLIEIQSLGWMQKA